MWNIFQDMSEEWQNFYFPGVFVFKSQMHDPYFYLTQCCDYRWTTLISVEFLQFCFAMQIRMDVVIIITLLDIMHIVDYMYQ